MKKQLTFLALLFLSNWGFSQGPSLEWAKSMGSTSSAIQERATAMTVDNSGNVYTVGTFSGTVDFDPGTGVSNLSVTTGATDVFIQKLDANGNFVWAKSVDATVGNGVALDLNGNILITGVFAGTADLDPSAAVFNLVSNGQEDVFVLKLNSSGGFVWAKSIGGSSQDVGIEIKSDKNNNSYVTGTFRGMVDFDPNEGTTNLTSNGFADVFILKLDPNGAFLWGRLMGGTSSEDVFDMDTDANDNVIITGAFLGTVDLNVNAGTNNVTSAGNKDIYILKLDLTGTYVWGHRIGGTGDDRGYGIAVDANSNIYTTGMYNGTVDFNPNSSVTNTLTSVGSYENAFVLKMSSAGNFAWAKSMGGSGTARAAGLGISVNSNGDVYSRGIFSSTVDFNPGTGVSNITASVALECYVQKLNTDGTYLWAFNISTGNGYESQVILAGTNCKFYVAGYFSGTVDFNPGTSVVNLTSNGNTDAFVAKFGEGTQGYNAAFTYDVMCDANGNALLQVTGGAQTVGNPEYCYYLYEYFPGTSNPDVLVQTVAWYQQASPYVYSQGPFTFPNPIVTGKHYYIKYGVWDACTGWQETRIYNIEAEEAAPHPEFHLRTTTNGAPTTSIGTCENIFLVETYEATHGMNYNRYYIDLWDRPCGSSGSFTWVSALGWYPNSTLPTALNIKTLFNAQGFFFSAGREYQVKLALGNECDGWEEVTYNFCVTNCTQPKPIGNTNDVDNTALEFVDDIKLYPNPTQGILNISSEESKIAEIRIVDALGRAIAIENNYNNQLDLSHLTPGVYMIMINTDKGLVNKQFVKQ